MIWAISSQDRSRGLATNKPQLCPHHYRSLASSTPFKILLSAGWHAPLAWTYSHFCSDVEPKTSAQGLVSLPYWLMFSRRNYSPPLFLLIYMKDMEAKSVCFRRGRGVQVIFCDLLLLLKVLCDSQRQVQEKVGSPQCEVCR